MDVFNPSRISLEKNDLVYSPGYNVGITAAKQLVTVHDLIHLRSQDERSILKSSYYNLFLRPVIRKTGFVLTVSQTSKSLIEEWLSDSDVSVVNVGNGCSSAFKHKVTADSESTDALVYVGNFKPHKNPEVLFKALKLEKDLSLLVISSDEVEFSRLANMYGVQKRVRRVANVSDETLAQIYADARAVLMPSLDEGFGLPALEALSVGTPVIYWKGCESITEIAAGSGIGLESANDPLEWASAMAAAVRGQLDKVDPKRWHETYNWDSVASKTLQAINALQPPNGSF